MSLSITPSVSPTSGTQSAPMSMTFGVSVTGTNEPYTYLWDFGDGYTSTDQSGSHPYAVGGSYHVSLVVTDALGYTASWSTTYTVNPALDVSFAAFVTIGSGGANSVAFSSSVQYGTPAYSYHWDLGDGNTSTAANPTHTYAEAGSYTVKLTVTDAQGHVVSASSIVSVVNQMIVNVTAVPVLGSKPLTINFTANASNGTAPYTYNWDFGDGGTGTGATPSHTFHTPGIYEVKVGVVDALGHDTGDRIVVDILNELKTDPLRIPERGAPPLTVTFYAKPAGGARPFKFHWDFLDGFTSTEENPVHTFKEVGFYNVRLDITDDLGRTYTNFVAVDTGGRFATGYLVTIYTDNITIYGNPFTIFGG